jgi:uncharacterized membrane protein YphA (DoxX/SURF4 family)
MNDSLGRIGSVWNRFWFAPVAPYSLALCRLSACAALLSFLLAEPAWVATSQLGVLGSLPHEFWRPIPALEVMGFGPPTDASISAAFGLTLTAVALLALGLFTRVSSVVCAAGAFYLLAVRNSWGKIYHDYHVLMVILLVLAVCNCGDALSLDSYRRNRSGKPAPEPSWKYCWPVKLIQLSYGLMFAFAAYNKLADGDGLEWVFSENMRNTLLVENFVHERTPTLLGPWVARHRALWTAGAAGIVLAQATAIGLVFIRQRFIRAAIFLLLGGFIAGRTLLMGMPEPIFAILTLVFVDWNAIEARRRRPLSVVVGRHEAGV